MVRLLFGSYTAMWWHGWNLGRLTAFHHCNSEKKIGMVTMVGNEDSFNKLIEDLIYLEHDAIAAYQATLKRLDDQSLSRQVAAFCEDHLQHLAALQDIAAEAGAEAPTTGDMKQMLTTGKIALADLIGDAAILKAMKTNEDDTVTAYKRASGHKHSTPAYTSFFVKAHADEERHRAWFDATARTL